MREHTATKMHSAHAGAAHLDGVHQVSNPAAVSAGHAVHLVHDEDLPLGRAVEIHCRVGHHLFHDVCHLAGHAALHIRVRLHTRQSNPGNGRAFRRERALTFPRASLAFTSITSKPRVAQMILAELVLPMPGGPLIRTAFLGASAAFTLTAGFGPMFLLARATFQLGKRDVAGWRDTPVP